MKTTKRWARSLMPALVLCCAAVALPASAQVASVKDPWVRSTVARQKSTSAYMEITASRTARLLEASSPVAGTVEIHEMRMEKDVMRMRALPSVDLPAGQPVKFEPGGHHIMLMDLKLQIKDGDKVPITLLIELRNGSRESIELDAAARSPQPSSAHGAAHGKPHSH